MNNEEGFNDINLLKTSLGNTLQDHDQFHRSDMIMQSILKSDVLPSGKAGRRAYTRNVERDVSQVAQTIEAGADKQHSDFARLFDLLDRSLKNDISTDATERRILSEIAAMTVATERLVNKATAPAEKLKQTQHLDKLHKLGASVEQRGVELRTKGIGEQFREGLFGLNYRQKETAKRVELEAKGKTFSGVKKAAFYTGRLLDMTDTKYDRPSWARSLHRSEEKRSFYDSLKEVAGEPDPQNGQEGRRPGRRKRRIWDEERMPAQRDAQVVQREPRPDLPQLPVPAQQQAAPVAPMPKIVIPDMSKPIQDMAKLLNMSLRDVIKEAATIRMLVEGRIKYDTERKQYMDLEKKTKKEKADPRARTGVTTPDRMLEKADARAAESAARRARKGTARVATAPVDHNALDEHAKLNSSVDANGETMNGDEKTQGAAGPSGKSPGTSDLLSSVTSSIVGGALLSRAGSALSKGAGKLLRRGSVPLLPKAASKVAGKTLGKALLKKIPVIGLLAGGAFAAQRLMNGDTQGAMLEAASGLASTVPGIGTAASALLDAKLAVDDVKKASGNVGASPVESGAAVEGMTDALKSTRAMQATDTNKPMVITNNNMMSPGGGGGGSSLDMPMKTRPDENSFLRFQDRRMVRVV